MLEIGKLDRVTVIVGERGTGKSTFLKNDCRTFQDETGGYILIHSPNGQIGDDDDIRFARDLKELTKNLDREPEKLHCLTQGSPEQLFAYAERLSLAIRKQAHEKANKPFSPTLPAPKGLRATPILIAIDEGAYLKRNPTNDETQELEQLLVSARHKHLAFTWSIQAPTARAWVLFEQATRFRIFRYVHEWGANALRAAGIPQEVLKKIKELPRFVYYQYDKNGSEPSGFKKVPKP